MTLDEAKAVAAIASTADGGCSTCVEMLMEKLQAQFPAFEWTYGPNPIPEPDDYDDAENGHYLDSVITVRTRPSEDEGMSEMVDRVGLALWDDLRDRRGIKHFLLHKEGLDHEATYADQAWWLREVALVAIMSMREPTDLMVMSGAVDLAVTSDVRRAWRGMIDVAGTGKSSEFSRIK